MASKLYLASIVVSLVVGCGRSTSSSGVAPDTGTPATCDAGAEVRRLVSLSSVRELPQPITSLAWSGALWITTTNALYRWKETHNTDPLEIAGSLGAPTALTTSPDELFFIADGASGRSIYRLPLSTDTPTAPIKVVDDVLNDVMAAGNGEVFYAVATGIARKRPPGMFPETEPRVFLTTEAPPVALVVAGGTLYAVVPKAGTDQGTILAISIVSTEPARELITTKLTKQFLPGAASHLWLEGDQLMEMPQDAVTAPTALAQVPGATRLFRLSDGTIGVLAGSRVVRFAGACREERGLDGAATAFTNNNAGPGFYVSVGPSLLRSTIL